MDLHVYSFTLKYLLLFTHPNCISLTSSVHYQYTVKGCDRNPYFSLISREPCRVLRVYLSRLRTCFLFIAVLTGRLCARLDVRWDPSASIPAHGSCAGTHQGPMPIGANAERNVQRYVRADSIEHSKCDYIGITQRSRPMAMLDGTMPLFPHALRH